VPALPENLEPGLYLVGGLAQDMQRWLVALEAGDTSPASSGETVVLFGCNAGRTFETARWLFTSAPCLDAARAAWLIHDGDIEAADEMLRGALARLEEITAAFSAALKP
jgi:phage terminase large subunit-like protein